MNSEHSISKILEMTYENKEMLSALNERSKNYYEIQHAQGEDIKSLHERVEVNEKDINILKRDRWWIGAISSFVGSLIMFIVSLFR